MVIMNIYLHAYTPSKKMLKNEQSQFLKCALTIFFSKGWNEKLEKTIQSTSDKILQLLNKIYLLNACDVMI